MQGGTILFKVLIFESDSFTARALGSLASEVSNIISAKYCLSLEHALESAKDESKFDLFVISVSSDQDDAGISFARAIKQSAKYGMVFMVFLMKVEDDRIRQIVCNEFRCYQILTMASQKFETSFKKALLEFSEYRLIRLGEGTITMLRDKDEKNIRISNILWIDIVDRVVTLNMTDGGKDQYLHSQYSLKKLLVMLEDSFIQIFRSVIVNKRYVDKIDYEEKQLKLKGVEQIFKIGHYYTNNLKKWFGDSKG